jgi:PhnB protein
VRATAQPKPQVRRETRVWELEYNRQVSKAPSYLPAGFNSLTVHLTVSGASQYIEFLKRAFDAIELARSSSRDGRLLNASVRIADSVMMLNDVFPEFGGEDYRSGRAERLTLYLPDADAAWAKAIAAGCKVVSPIGDQFWGDRYGEVEDPYGYVWAIATHLEDLTAEEIEGRRKKAFGGGPPTQASHV